MWAGSDAAALFNGAGAVWAGGDRFATDPRTAALRANSLQKYMREKTRLGIPAFAFAEALHGYMAAGATSFPAAVALGGTWDTGLVERVFTAAAQEASARGVRQVLSPVLDLSRDPRWGRFEECYGEDPYLVSRMGMAAIFGLQGRAQAIDAQHVAVTLKHFAGHGQPEGGRNIAPVSFSEREFRTNHLYPFEMAVKVAHAHSIMASYNEWDGVPNHVNHRLLTDILRSEWGFDGYVMSDGGGIDVRLPGPPRRGGPRGGRHPQHRGRARLRPRREGTLLLEACGGGAGRQGLARRHRPGGRGRAPGEVPLRDVRAGAGGPRRRREGDQFARAQGPRAPGR